MLLNSNLAQSFISDRTEATVVLASPLATFYVGPFCIVGSLPDQLACHGRKFRNGCFWQDEATRAPPLFLFAG